MFLGLIDGWTCVNHTPTYSIEGIDPPYANTNAGSAFLGISEVDDVIEAVGANTCILPANKKYIFSMYKKSKQGLPPSSCLGNPVKTRVVLNKDTNGDGMPDAVTGNCPGGSLAYSNTKTIYEDLNYMTNLEFERVVSCFELSASEANFGNVVIFPFDLEGDGTTCGSFFPGVTVTRVELVKDEMENLAGSNITINCQGIVTLGEENACEISDVYYKWEKVTSPNVYELVVENLPLPTHTLTVTETTTFRLTREFRDYLGNVISACPGMVMEDFVTVTVTPCNPLCSCPNGGTYIGAPNQTTYVSQHPEIQMGENECFVVNGSLVFDMGPAQVYNFSNCEFIMLPNSEIIVESGHLEITNYTKLFGCDYIWKGITVLNDATLTTNEFSQIEDAEIAITAGEASTVNTSETFFLHNIIGLYSEVKFILNGMFGNVFDGAGLPPPYAGQNGAAGIFLSNGTTLSIGGNDFLNLTNGIILKSKNAVITGGTFSNINNFGNGLADVPGAAIYANAVNLMTPKRMAHSGGIFTNCRYGIYCYGVSNTISGTKMSGGIFGIASDFAATRALITNNEITCNKTAIEVSHSFPEAERLVKNNQLNIIGKGIGIWMNEEGTSNPKIGTIELNTINLGAAGSFSGYGIRLVSTSKIDVLDNTINFQPGLETGYGISLNGGSSNTVKENKVNGQAALIGENVAIEGYGSPGTIWQCNQVQNTPVGFSFRLPSSTSGGFRGNTMNYHKSGLRIWDNGSIGGQVHTSNYWEGTYDDGAQKAARNDASATLSPFRAKQNGTGQSAYLWPSSIFPPDGWFISDNNPTQSSICPLISIPPCPEDGTDLLIAGGNTSQTGNIKWMTERYLYRKLKEETNCAQLGTVFTDFLDQKSSTTVGKFFNMERDIALHFAVSESVQSELQGNIGLFDTKVEILSNIEIQLPTASGQTYVDLLAERNVQLEEIDVLTESDELILNGIKSQRASNVEILQSNNASIVTDYGYEQNEKDFHQIFIATVGSGSDDFTAFQIEALTSIANQCPATGGNAVFKARSLLAAASQIEQSYDDVQLCGPKLLKGNAVLLDYTDSNPSVSLFPNPGKDKLTLKWQSLDGTVGAVTLTDIMGRIVLKSSLDVKAGILELNLSALEPGIYTCKILVDEKPVLTEKYVLLK